MKLYHQLFVTGRFFYAGWAVIALFVLAVLLPLLYWLAALAGTVLLMITLTDVVLLFREPEVKPIRSMADRFSNGDVNEVAITLHNPYAFRVKLTLRDEAPVEFQRRDHQLLVLMEPGDDKQLRYTLRPVKRGEYRFGQCRAFYESPLGLVQRMMCGAESEQTVKVYPSFHHMKAYELMALADRKPDAGSYQVRTEALALEFDQIREYAQGDEIRAINWAASARVNKLMVNQYREERAQQVYMLIDSGRVMEMPFSGMMLLDYAINASLALSRVVLQKQDKPGLLTFSDRMHQFLPAKSDAGQQQLLMENLYRLQTDYAESSYEALYLSIRRMIPGRSSLLLFSNVETMHSLKRKLPVLQRLNKRHVLVVILFRNTEVEDLHTSPTESVTNIYDKAMAERMMLEKQEMLKTLRKAGIRAMLTRPEQLSIQAINAYLGLKKARVS
jgi:uncharacterized protein (DUF58 family)